MCKKYNKYLQFASSINNGNKSDDKIYYLITFLIRVERLTLYTKDDDYDGNNNNNKNIKSGIVVVTRPVSPRLWSGKRELQHFAVPHRYGFSRHRTLRSLLLLYSYYHCSGGESTLDCRVNIKCVCFSFSPIYFKLFSFLFDTTTLPHTIS